MKIELISLKAKDNPSLLTSLTANKELWVALCLTRIPCFNEDTFVGWHDALKATGQTQQEAEKKLVEYIERLLPKNYSYFSLEM
jgi:hypothetical protein